MFIELQRGRSFRGLTKYCLGPGEAGVEERVAFIETRNLATSDAEAAWRVMAARHYMQDELKASHGIRRGDRGKPVGHMLISWGAEEAANQNLDRKAMMEAAQGALAAIGAEKHQAIVIAHNDTEERNPHCHVIINLIGDDGRLKDNTNEKRKLSRFALEHEIKVHGEPVVRLRYRNWQDRVAGEKPAPVKKKARHLFELDKATEAGWLEPQQAKKMLEDQRSIEIKKQEFEAIAAKRREKLQWCREERIRRAEKQAKAQIKETRTGIRKAYRSQWNQLDSDHFEQRKAFNSNEKTMLGSLGNAIQLVDWNSLEFRGGKLSKMFNLLTSERSRREEMMHRQQFERTQLREQQREEEALAIARIRSERTDSIDRAKKLHIRKSERMKQRQEAGRQRLKQHQKAITKERNAALREFRAFHRKHKKDRSEERLYIKALGSQQLTEAAAARDDQSEQGQSTIPKRRRRVRDPRVSRRKRKQRHETDQQYQERLAANENRREQPHDRDH